MCYHLTLYSFTFSESIYKIFFTQLNIYLLTFLNFICWYCNYNVNLSRFFYQLRNSIYLYIMVNVWQGDHICFYKFVNNIIPFQSPNIRVTFNIKIFFRNRIVILSHFKLSVYIR